MNVIAFRPRAEHAPMQQLVVGGTFRSPRGRAGRMTGSVRVQRLVLAPRGAFLTGVFTGELRDDDGSLIGVGSRRATTPANLVHDAQGFWPWVRPFPLDVMGITVEIAGFAVDPALAFPPLDPATRRPLSIVRAPSTGPAS